MKILILGYYYRNNIGDDIFEYIFKNYLNKYWPNVQYIIKNTDDINVIPNDISLIICGGGDIINNYFLDKINLLTHNINIPVYAISIGFPYINMLNDGVLDRFDYIIHRNKSDNQYLLNKYGPNRIQYFPDLAFLLPNFSSLTLTDPSFASITQVSSKYKKIGVFLSKTIYNSSNPQAYNKILDNLAYFIVKLAKSKTTGSILSSILPNNTNNKINYQIFLLSCCTSNNPDEDDRQINIDLMTKINNYDNFTNIHLIHQSLPINEIIPLFKQFYFTICTRFHAHIISMLAKVPFISIYSSRKVENLLATSNLKDYAVQMEVDPITLAPILLNSWDLFEKYNLLIDNYSNYRNTLNILYNNYTNEMNGFTQYFDNLLFTPIRNINNPLYLESQTENITGLIATKIVDYFGNYLSTTDKISFTLQLAAKNKNFSLSIHDFISLTHISDDDDDCCTNQSLKCFIAELIIYYITGLRVTEFNYGLEEQIFTPNYHLYESVKWILQYINDNNNNNNNNENNNNQLILTNPVKINLRKFNMQYFKQHDLNGFHRSGWEYVVNHLNLFHNPNGIIFDSFLDKTFGWNYDFYCKINILPFTKSWVGIFHHTPNEDFSINNLINAFDKPLFIQSLQYCNGIYVLSYYLKNWISQKLKNVNYSNIPVNVLIHPTEFVSNTFTYQNFLNNPNKRVIQIGAWLRNTYAIFQLPSPSNLKKTALKGKNMDNYYISDHHFNKIKNTIFCTCVSNTDTSNKKSLTTSLTSRCELSIPSERPHHCNSICNKYVVGLINMIDENNKSVEILPNVTNDEYDQLLSENIVFINLVDASAVNTLIECIVRNTPILVNRLPAIEEYIGSNYPLFYDTFYEAYQLLNDFNQIKKGYTYLTKLNKDKFNIEYFLENFVHSNIFNSLN